MATAYDLRFVFGLKGVTNEPLRIDHINHTNKFYGKLYLQLNRYKHGDGAHILDFTLNFNANKIQNAALISSHKGKYQNNNQHL